MTETDRTGPPRRRQRIFGPWWLMAPVLALAVLAPAACSDDQAGGARPSGPPPVTVATPVVREVRNWDEYSGRFSAVGSVEVRARVSGYLEQVHFRDGQMIEEGDLLFTIDQRPFKLAVSQAKAELESAKAALTLAEKEVERARNLVGKGNISQSVFDQRVQARDGARASVARARAAVQTAELNLTFTQIRAPIAGRISRNLVSVGNLVTGGAAGTTLLTTIVTLDPIYFYFDADEAAYLRYVRLAQSGQRPSSRQVRNPVLLKLADEKDYKHRGRMDFVENQIDRNSGTITGRAVFANKRGLFTPGMFARIRLLGSGLYKAVLVPDEVIGTDQSRRFVYVVADDGTVGIRIVQPGRLIGGLRVITSGLKAEDRIIIKGLQRARPGQKVKPMPGRIEAGPSGKGGQPRK